LNTTDKLKHYIETYYTFSFFSFRVIIYKQKLKSREINHGIKITIKILELLNINNSFVCIHYTILMTMVDGQVTNNLIKTSNQVCYICKCNPKNISDLDNMNNFQLKTI